MEYSNLQQYMNAMRLLRAETYRQFAQKAPDVLMCTESVYGR